VGGYVLVIDDKMTVMQVRPSYSIVYQFKPQLRIESGHVRSEKDFVGFIKEISGNWRDGDYFFRCSHGTFAYFTLNGRRVRLSRKSRQGKEYLCWQYFSQSPHRVSKKRVALKVSAVRKRMNKKVE